MVRLTMTPGIVRALERLQHGGQLPEPCDDPSLDESAVGKPISHGQIIAISSSLKSINDNLKDPESEEYASGHLDILLRGAQVYIEPPKPKQEPVATILYLFRHSLLLILDRHQSTKH